MESGLLQQQIGAAAAVAWIIERLKTYSWFPLLNVDSDKLNRVISVVTAFFVSAGFTWSYQGNIFDGGAFTVVIPKAADLWAFGTTFAGSMGLQELFYRGAVKPTPKTVEIESAKTTVIGDPGQIEIHHTGTGNGKG